MPVGKYSFEVTLGEYNSFYYCTYILTVEIYSETIDGEIGPSECGSWSRRRRLSASTAEDLLYFPTFSGWTGEIELNVVQDYEELIYNLTKHESSEQFYLDIWSDEIGWQLNYYNEFYPDYWAIDSQYPTQMKAYYNVIDADSFGNHFAVGDTFVINHMLYGSDDMNTYCIYQSTVKIVPNTLPYFLEWNIISHIEREVNSGLTVVNIPWSAYRDE